MTTVVNAGSVRNRFDAFNIKCAELRKMQLMKIKIRQKS